MKNLRIIIIGVLLLSLTACEQHHLFTIRLQHLDSLANEDPARADTLLNTLLPTMEDHTTPLHAGRGWGEGLLLLRIKVDDKLYRPITQYRDTILHLVNYFEKETHSLSLFNVSTFQRLNLSSAYLYAGRVFSDLGDAPQALDYYQRALDALPETPSAYSGYSTRRLYKQRGLLHSLIGEMFYFQNLNQNALESFRQANHWAKLSNDTLDMIFNYRDMAEEYKILEKFDSSLYYYKEALEYANNYRDIICIAELNVQIARLYKDQGLYHIAKQYIQPALQYVDSADMSSTYNIAAQIYQHDNNIDSAYYYYTKLLKIGNSYGKINAFRELSNFALQRNDIHTATEYFKQYKTLDDSIRSLDNAKTIARMHAAYNYSIREKEAQKYKEANARKRNIIVFVTLLAIIFALMILWLFSKYRIRQQRLIEMEHAHEELRSKYLLLTEDHQRKLAETDLLLQKKDKDIKELQLLTQKREDILHAQRLASIEREKIEENTEYIQNTPIFRKMIHSPESIRNHEEEWKQIELVINEVYPGFSDRLKKFIPKMNEREKHISLLLKAHIGHQIIADILCVTQNGESNIRRRLSNKVLPQETPSATKFDGFIESL